MDALLKALEERGHRVEVQEVKAAPPEPSYYGKPVPTAEPRWHTFAVVENTPVEFGLEEGYETIEVPPPPPSGARETRSWDLPRLVKERIPNGRLILAIRNAPQSERLTCGDTKRQAIEARLGAFILFLEATSVAIRAARVEAARQAEENPTVAGGTPKGVPSAPRGSPREGSRQAAGLLARGHSLPPARRCRGSHGASGR